MDILKILGIALAVTVLSAILKNYRPEFSVSVIVVFGTLFLLYICKSAENVFEGIRDICDGAGIKTIYLEIMFKVIGVSYMCEFISSVCRDAGESSIAVKVDVAGKLIILSASLPVFRELINLITRVAV